MGFATFKGRWVVLALALLAFLAGWGGGGGSSGPPLLGGGGGGATASKVDVTSSNGSLGDGQSTLTLTAVVKDAGNVAIPDAPVNWVASAGSLTGAALKTDASGVATATFSASDRSAGTATITVTSGAAVGTVSVLLQGARTVALSTSNSSVPTDGSTATITASVKDANNVAIGGAAVSWSTSVGSLVNQTSVTDAQGRATAVFTPGAGASAGEATISATSGGATGSVKVQIVPSTTSIELLAATPTIGTGGDQVVISAFVKDGSNIAKPGVQVSWSVDKGRISNQSGVTDANGVARATLDAGSDKSNRTALVTVISGAARQTLSVPIINSKIAVSGATTVQIGSTLQLNLTAADSKGLAIPGAVLSLTSSLGNAVPATVNTDGVGQATVTYQATRAGTDNLSVTGVGANLTVVLTVSGGDEDLVFVSPAPSAKVVVGQPQVLTLRYRKLGVPQANTTLNLAATIGTLSTGSVVTDANGQATVTVQSGFAGSSIVSVRVAGTPVQASLPLSFVATTPATLVLQVTPTALAPNLAGATSNQATVLAKVTDANGNPVADVTVNFSQLADPSGGVLQQASAITDLNGVATVQYQSGAQSTASGAVQLRGEVAGAPVRGDAVLTVNQSALFIALGTGNTISNFDPQTYQKDWTVYVTDANGVRVTNVPVTIKVIPNYFAKGFLIYSDAATQWVYAAYAECPNEDRANLNGRLDPGEDTNNDGSLTPGNVVALNSSTVTTDSSGAATITMRYAELYAPWIGVRLTATAIVAGTESTTFKDFPLDKLASDFSAKTVAPAGVRSPFGIDTTTCTNAN